MSGKKVMTIPYGPQETVSFELPAENLLSVLLPPDYPAVADLAAEVRRALAEPIGAAPLRQVASGKKNVVILADDKTRLTPTDVILPELLDELNQAGVADEQMTLLVALGTHRAMSEEELLAKYGQQVLQRVRIVNHNYRDLDNLLDLGRTANGTPILINRLVKEADLAIGVGSVYPHHLPGFAGGGKIVQPGVSGQETTGATHLLGCRVYPSYLGHVDNPVRREMDAVACSAGLDYILNAVQNEHGRTVGVFAGDLQAAFRAAAGIARQALSAPFSALADIVISGSYPADLEFWQAHKALYPADMVGKPGSTLIVVTPCPEGVSVMHGQMLEYTAWPPQDVEAAAVAGKIHDVPAAALALAWSLVRQGRQVSIISGGLTDEEAGQLGFVRFRTVGEALEDAFRRHGSQAKVTVLPKAAETLPVRAE